MSYELLLNEQIENERNFIKQVIKRLQDQNRKVEEQNYASASVYGCASISTLLPLVCDEIERTVFNATVRGKNGTAFKEINKHLKGIEPLALAGISCKMVFDCVFSFSKNGEANEIKHVTKSIALAVEQECQMRHYEAKAPGLLNKLKESYWHEACGTQQKLTVIKTMMNRCEVEPFKPWANDERCRLGTWLLNTVMSVSGWFEPMNLQIGKKNRETLIVPTAEFCDIRDKLLANAEIYSPLKMPMLIPPKDWSFERPGGYILNELADITPIIRANWYNKHPLEQNKEVYDYLNKIQKVAWKVNSFIYEVAEVLMERKIQVGKFLPTLEYPFPPKPADIAENKESRQSYRRLCAEAYNKNKRAFKNSCRTRMCMETAQRFKDVSEFFIPWSYDYRGRSYPIPSFLAPQDTDFGKSLLLFAEPAQMTPDAEDWLSFQIATSYGLDKAPMDERLEWAHNHHALISRIARDPISNLSEWEAADEPWLFLAACDEYYHCVIVKDRETTQLPVFTDATCSGLQILAGLARDLSTAKMVNVVPSDKPQDAYKVVAEAAAPNCPESIRPFMNRKVVKRVVMTIPYNSKPHSNRQYIQEALEDAGWKGEYQDILDASAAVRDAMEHIFPGTMKVMAWIESEVGKAIKAGATELNWTTPSGFTCRQKLMKSDTVVLKLQLLGKIVKQTIATDDNEKVDLPHHKNATAPNLIHSLDADLIRLAALDFQHPIGLIHDSVMSRATDMSNLSDIVRKTYMHLFAEHDYLREFAKQIGAETEPPIIGDLKPEKVINSTYFFC